ncbi:MAG: polymerase subunit sigma-24 [Sediminibacterium sp.]|nr:polymerase subunit sigma-24 [Sediminibacterium sp.]
MYHRYHVAIYQNIYRLTKDAAATEDLVQETFITVWQKRDRIVTGRSLAGWLFVISYHLSVNYLKRKLVELKAAHTHTLTIAHIETVDDYDRQMALLDAAILKLSPQKRRVFTLCKLRGKTYQQAANELNISNHSVKEYLSGAMKAVREYTVSHPEYIIALPLLQSLLIF